MSALSHILLAPIDVLSLRMDNTFSFTHLLLLLQKLYLVIMMYVKFPFINVYIYALIVFKLMDLNHVKVYEHLMELHQYLYSSIPKA